MSDKPHVFWGTQPVPSDVDQNPDAPNGPIDPNRPVSEVRQEPYPLPDGFDWVETNIDDQNTIQEIYTLLSQNYVEDDDAMFRFDYSIPFLLWALKPPHFFKEWHIGVRHKASGKLMAFITGIPATIRAYDKTVPMTEINFLCVHKKLRSKRLAPVLIKEITRRVHLKGIFQAVYTAGVRLPNPVASCRYHHRSLNPKKLIEVGFSHLPPRMTLSMTIKFYRLPEAPETRGVRAAELKDVPAIHGLVTNYLTKFSVTPVFSQEEVAHWLLPHTDIIHSYVVEDPITHTVTDFFSFYILPSSVLGNKKYNLLKAAYSFYNVASQTPLTKLMRDALVMAKQVGCDVYNCLDIFENESFLSELKFGIGDGHLQYYLYNWKCPAMQPKQVGLVLL